MIHRIQMTRTKFLIKKYFINSMSFLAPLSLLACSSAAHRVELPSGTDPQTQLVETENRLMNDRLRQYDELSPRHFKAAQSALSDARKKWEKGSSSEKVLDDVGEAMGELQVVEENGRRGLVALSSVLSARAAAKNVKADVILQKQFQSVDQRLKSLGEDIEVNRFNPESAQLPELAGRYSELELLAIKDHNLADVEFMITKNKKEGAERKAPESYRSAQMHYDAALLAIEVNRHEPEVYDMPVKKAVKSAQKLDQVMTTLENSKTTEGVAVQMYDQQQKLAESIESIQVLRGENREYAAREALYQKIEFIKSTIAPSEAEVVRDGQKIVVRLKSMMFESARADLTSSSVDTLRKVKKLIAAVPISKVVVEGHTDAIGTIANNKKLSQKRAEAVMKYFITEKALLENQVEARGLGDERPLTTNKIQKGRAMNRRVDVVIETTAEI